MSFSVISPSLLPSTPPSPSSTPEHSPAPVTPPPTTNCLGPSQRARLLRSTRKLGDMLGATPFLLETSSDAIYGEEFANIVREECVGAFASELHSPSDAQFVSLVSDSQRNSFLNSTFTTLLAPITPSQLMNKPSITVLTLPTGEKLLPPSPTGARVPPTPRTRKSRRQGQCFHSPSSSVTSVDDDLDGKATLYTSDDDYVFVSSNNPPASRYHYHSLATAEKPNFDRKAKPAALISPQMSLKTRKSRSQLPPIAMTFEVEVPLTSGLKSAKSTRSLKHKSSKQQLIPKSPKTPKSRSRSKSNSQQLAQPLILRLRSVPIQHSHHGQTYSVPVSPPSSPLSPCSPTFNNSYPPMTSFMKLDDRNSHKASEQARRKKMAKLTRTLGENIPPELVFGPAPTRGGVPAQSPSLSRPRATTVSKTVDAITESAPPIPSKETVTILATKGIKRAHRPRSLTLGPVSGHLGHTVAMSVDRPVALAPISLVAPPKPSHQRAPSPSLDREFGKRRERGWSGEWNKDMNQVVKALRGLKAR